VTADDYLVAPVDEAARAQARAALVRAIDACVMTRHGLAHMLGEDRPSWTAEIADGLKHYGPGDRFLVWQWWRNTERLREAADAWEHLAEQWAAGKPRKPA